MLFDAMKTQKSKNRLITSEVEDWNIPLGPNDDPKGLPSTVIGSKMETMSCEAPVRLLRALLIQSIISELASLTDWELINAGSGKLHVAKGAFNSGGEASSRISSEV